MEKIKLWVDENGVIRESHDAAIIDWDAAMYAAAERERLAGDKRMPLLVQFNKMFAFTTETRDLDTEVVLKNVSAVAYLVLDSTIGKSQQYTIRSYFEKTPWPVPVKIFFKEIEAINWLKEHITEEGEMYEE